MLRIKISVIVPVYNVEEYVEECINSIVNQSMKDIEIIIVNDGSTDKSLDKVNIFDGDNRIKIINKKNGGLSSARNKGLEVARGEYVLFLDSDDFLVNNNCLQEVYNVAKKNKSDIIECSFHQYYENGEMKKCASYLGKFENDIVTSEEYLEKLSGENFVPVCFKVFKLSFLNKNKLFFKEGFLHEDEDFSPRAVLCSRNISIYRGDFYGYRYREGSITRSQNIKRVNDSIAICCDLIRYYNTLQLNKSIKLLKNRAIEMILENIYVNKMMDIDNELKKYIFMNSNTILNKFKAILLFINVKCFCVINKNIIRILAMKARILVRVIPEKRRKYNINNIAYKGK